MGTAVTVSNTKNQGSNGEAPVSLVYSFARTLGTAHRKTLSDSEELNKAYNKLGDGAKLTMKLEFMIGYVAGVLGSQRDSAETIINGRVRLGAKPTRTKPARTKEQQNAYDAARKMFSFHISRDDKRVIARTKPIRLSSGFKEAAIEFVGTFFEEVNATSIAETIRMLQALKTRIDKILPPEPEEQAAIE